MGRERLIRHTVPTCVHCGLRHDYAVLVRAKSPEVLVFGGPGHHEVVVPCPETGEMATIALSLGNNEEFVRLVGAPGEAGDRASEAEGGTAGAALDDEYVEWVKASRATALDFCRSMLTSASGAVAVYFAVLAYLGSESLPRTAIGTLSVAPPLLFIAAAAMFAAASRPHLAPVTTESFARFRTERLARLSRYMTAGSALFLAGLAVAAIVFVLLLDPL